MGETALERAEKELTRAKRALEDYQAKAREIQIWVRNAEEIVAQRTREFEDLRKRA